MEAVGNQPVDQPQPVKLRRFHGFAGDDHFAGDFRGHEGVDLGPDPPASQPSTGLGDTEPGVLGGDDHVALGSYDDTCPQRVTVDCGDNRLPVYCPPQVALRVRATLAAGAFLRRHGDETLLYVGSGAEGAACAVDDADPGIIVGIELQQRLVQVLLELAVDCVQNLRAVEHYVGNPALAFIGHCFVLNHRPSRNPCF